MLINNVNESTFNARMLTYGAQPATIITYTDWLRQSINPLNYGKKEQYKAITITFLIADKDKASCMLDISNLVKAIEQATLKFDDLPYYYDTILSGTPAIRTFLENRKYYLDVSLQSGHAYLPTVSTTLSGQSQVVAAQGNLPSPTVVTLTPTQDIDDVSLTGLTKTAITVNTLHSGAPVTIDGEKGIITEPDLDTIMTSATGSGKWMFRKYNAPNIFSPDVMNANYIPTIDTIPDNSAYTQMLISDAADLVHNIGYDYVGHLKTGLYVSAAKSIDITISHDDGCSIYLNSNVIYQQNHATHSTITFPLNTGWNIVRIVWINHFGYDGIFGISPVFGTQVDQLNAYYARDTSFNGTVNKFPDTDMQAFPVIQPGNNTVSISDSTCGVTIAYKPKFM